jgi:hypothetical protein
MKKSILFDTLLATLSLSSVCAKVMILYVELPSSLVESNDKIYQQVLSQLTEEQKKKIIQENQKKKFHNIQVATSIK